ncbi:transposase [Proteinivorax tanatarense]|uniref:Transposase n=1 Tax=Proteinivorax tanatarense TaxID=1260629 RepID=A0AAU7VMU0_9FIRM
MKKYKQISFANFNQEFDELLKSKQPTLIELFSDFLEVDEIIPASFYDAYYSSLGRNRDYSLSSMISALILQKILSLPHTKTLLNILALSKELRDFCGFDDKLPDPAQFTRFKQNFLPHIEQMFHNLVDDTEALCHDINDDLADILISDTTGFEAFVKENNPKFYETLLTSAKKYAKIENSVNPHSLAASKMPKMASANNEFKLSHLNGHFGYYLKTNVVTNGLGIVRHIDFYDLDLETISPELKDEYDSKTLIPVLENFFKKHPLLKYKYFLGDAGFDSYDNYRYLYCDKNMIPIIPLNQRRKSDLPSSGFTDDGTPTCPHDSSLKMNYDGVAREKGRADRVKFKCPKSKKKRVNGKQKSTLDCQNPCTSSSYGRVTYVPIHKNYRLNCAIPRDSEKWSNLYKVRTICERAIAQLKHSMSLRSSKLYNTKTLKADILLAAITQLTALTVLHRANNTSAPMSIKNLVA